LDFISFYALNFTLPSRGPNFVEVASTTQNTDRAWSKSNTALLHRQLLPLVSLAGLSRRLQQALKLDDEGIRRTKAGSW
jgi:hypothetical protein